MLEKDRDNMSWKICKWRRWSMCGRERSRWGYDGQEQLRGECRVTGGNEENEGGVRKRAAVRGSSGRGSSSLIPSGRQIACVANDWLKLLLLLRTAANMTANKGIVERCRIPAVAQLSPEISQIWALLLLPLHSPASQQFSRNGAPSATFSEGYFCIKGALVRCVIEFVPFHNAEDTHSIKHEVVFLWSEALFFFDCYL